MWIIAQVYEGTDNFPRTTAPKCFYADKKAAERAAKEKAKEFPQVQFAVFGIVTIFEAAEPTVIEKFINEDGETEVRK